MRTLKFGETEIMKIIFKIIIFQQCHKVPLLLPYRVQPIPYVALMAEITRVSTIGIQHVSEFFFNFK